MKSGPQLPGSDLGPPVQEGKDAEVTSRRSGESILLELRMHGSLEGNLSSRYSRLKQRMPAVVPGGWLYYAGASTVRHCPNATRYAGQIFSKIGFPAGVIPFEGCSGEDLLAMGYPELARAIAVMTRELIQQVRPVGVVCGSERDAWILQHCYPAWGLDLEAPVVSASELFTTLHREGLLALRGSESACRWLFIGSLGSNEWLESRDGITALLGEALASAPLRCDSLEERIPPLNSLTGAAWSPEGVAEALVEEAWTTIETLAVERVITDDPLTYEALYFRADGTPVEVMDVNQVIARSLRA